MRDHFLASNERSWKNSLGGPRTEAEHPQPRFGQVDLQIPQNVKPNFHSLLLHGLFQFIQIPRKPSLEPKIDLNGRDFSAPSLEPCYARPRFEFNTRSLRSLGIPDATNRNTKVGRCSSGRHPIRRRPARSHAPLEHSEVGIEVVPHDVIIYTTVELHSSRCFQRSRSSFQYPAGGRPANLKSRSSSCR